MGHQNIGLVAVVRQLMADGRSLQPKELAQHRAVIRLIPPERAYRLGIRSLETVRRMRQLKYGYAKKRSLPSLDALIRRGRVLQVGRAINHLLHTGYIKRTDNGLMLVDQPPIRLGQRKRGELGYDKRLRERPWTARIEFRGKRYWLGSFATKEEAHIAIRKATSKLKDGSDLTGCARTRSRSPNAVAASVTMTAA